MGQLIDVPGMGQVEFPDGMTDAQIVAAIKANAPKAESRIPGMETAKSVANTVNTGVNWLGTQITKGATGLLGGADALGTLGERGAAYVGEKLGAPETGKNVGHAFKRNVTFHGLAPNTEAMNRIVFGSLGVPEVNAGDNPAFTLTNPFGIEGKVNLGKMADVGVQAIPGSLALGGGALPAVLGGATSEAAGQAEAGTPWELPARVVGALPGAWAGSKITTPLPANLTPQQARAVAIAKETGTPLSVAQETGRGTALERFFSRMPGGQGVSERFAAKQGASTDRAALAQAGFVGDDVGTETVKALQRQASAEFEAAKNMPSTVNLTPGFFDTVKGTAKKYAEDTPASDIAPVVGKKAKDLTKLEPGAPSPTPLTASAVERSPTLNNILNAIKDVDTPPPTSGGPRLSTAQSNVASWFGEAPKVPMPKAPPELTNAQYQTLRKSVSDSVDDLYKGGDSGSARALQKMRDALDDAAASSLPAEQMEAWKTARRHYFNFKIIEKAAGRGTVASRSEGTLSPSALTSVLRQKQGDAFSRTTGGLNDVATLKQYLADTFPNSGTPTIGAQAFAFMNPLLAGAPAAAVNLSQRAMTGAGPVSSVVRSYLANQSAPNRLQSVATVPFALAPSILADQRLRLTDQRRGQ